MNRKPYALMSRFDMQTAVSESRARYGNDVRILVVKASPPQLEKNVEIHIPFPTVESLKKHRLIGLAVFVDQNAALYFYGYLDAMRSNFRLNDAVDEKPRFGVTNRVTRKFTHAEALSFYQSLQLSFPFDVCELRTGDNLKEFEGKEEWIALYSRLGEYPYDNPRLWYRGFVHRSQLPCNPPEIFNLCFYHPVEPVINTGHGPNCKFKWCRCGYKVKIVPD
jgi:hypothetical protein